MPTYFEPERAAHCSFCRYMTQDNKPSAAYTGRHGCCWRTKRRFFHPDAGKPYQRTAADAAIRHHSGACFGESTLPAEFVVIPLRPSLITSVFMHGGWLHLGGNMLYLWIFGDNVEDKMGPLRFALFYLLCGAAASLAHVMVWIPEMKHRRWGASGAIAGVLAAYHDVPAGTGAGVHGHHHFYPLDLSAGFCRAGGMVAAPDFCRAGVDRPVRRDSLFCSSGRLCCRAGADTAVPQEGVPLMQTVSELNAANDITPVPMRTVRNEFVDRYRHRRNPSRGRCRRSKRKPGSGQRALGLASMLALR